jgi:hypothetical protein
MASEAGVKYDYGKPRVDLVLGHFPLALMAVSEVGTFGAAKYTDNGWETVENGLDRYRDASMRHYLMYSAGEEYDEESKLLHAAHEAWNKLAALELYLRGYK